MRDESRTKRRRIEALEPLRREREQGLPCEAPGGSETLFRDLVENVNDVLFRIDRNGVILYISPVAEPMVGYGVGDLVGRPFAEFIFPEDLETAFRQFRRSLDGEAAVGEFRVVHRTGRLIWAKSSSRPTVEGGRIVGAQGIVTDISERKRVEDALWES